MKKIIGLLFLAASIPVAAFDVSGVPTSLNVCEIQTTGIGYAYSRVMIIELDGGGSRVHMPTGNHYLIGPEDAYNALIRDSEADLFKSWFAVFLAAYDMGREVDIKTSGQDMNYCGKNAGKLMTRLRMSN